MKTHKILFVTLFLTFTLSEIYVCEANIAAIIKGVGIAVKVGMAVRKQLKEQHDQVHEDHVEQNKKLDGIRTEIKTLENQLTSHVKTLLMAIEKQSNDTIHEQIASKFEESMQGVDKKLEDIIFKEQKFNKKVNITGNEYIKDEIRDLKSQLESYKDAFEIILREKDVSHDFLVAVMNNANVCKDNMSQMQLLDAFRALYVDTMSRYLLARHILISLRKDDANQLDQKADLNEEVSNHLVKYGKRFQKLMVKSSREYQHCTPLTKELQYKTYVTPKESENCYMTKNGDSGKIVEFGPHRKLHNHCYDYFSLREAKARSGYVVVGAKIERNVNILYIRVIEGKLLPNGMIDPESITHNTDPEPGMDDEVVKFDLPHTFFDTTKTLAPDDRVVTGLKFSVTSDKHIYLDILSKVIDLEKGILIEGSTRSEPHTKGLTKETRKYYRPSNSKDLKINVPPEAINTIYPNGSKPHLPPKKILSDIYHVDRNSIGLQPVKPDEYLQFHPGHNLIHPYIEMADVYPTPLTLLSGASLYHRYVEGTEGYLSIRLFTFNVAPYVTTIDFDNQDYFNDVLNQI